MPSKSKGKGNRGESELALKLSAALGGHFARVPNSGAMIGGLNTHRKSYLSETQTKIYKGDLIPPDHLKRFVVESKSYDDFRFHQLLTPGPCAQLDEWIGQCRDCIDPGDAWFVCFKITRISWFVAVPDAGQDYAFGNHCVYLGAHGRFRVTGLVDFFEQNREAVLRNSR